jgi:Concanavalin A-like lectin/glucanases superfamily
MKKIKSDVVDDADTSKVPHLIEIDPVNYSGVYYVANDEGVNIAYRYKNRFSLDVGQHFISIGGNNQTSFEVLANGTIANISNNDALMAQGNKLIFKNVSVEIDPQQYIDAYFPSIFHRLVDELKTNKQTFVFVPALEYYVELYDSGYDKIDFQVDANGNVQNISNPGAAETRGRSLVFYNVKAVINPVTYAQNYVFAKQVRKFQSEVTLVPNTRLLIYIAENAAQSFVSIKNTHIEPAFVDLKDYNNASHRFFFAVKPEVVRTHWWKGQNNTNDDANHPSSSTVLPPDSITYVDGIDGKAFNFTGTGYIEVTNPFETELGAVDFWFKWNGGAYNQVLMGSCITNVPPMRPGCDNRTPLFAIYNGANFSWEFSDQFNLVDCQIQQNIWYHVYFTYESHSGGYAIAFYIRPQNEPTDKLIYAKFDNIAPISSFNTYYGIGKGTQSVTANGFNGIIDEVKIFGNPSPPTKQKSKRKSK